MMKRAAIRWKVHPSTPAVTNMPRYPRIHGPSMFPDLES